MSISKRHLVHRLLSLFIAVLFIPILALAEAPPKPEGFATEADVRKAIATKKVPLINVTAPPAADVIVEKDIEYARVGDRALKLDLYRPKNQKGVVPGVIVIHGGGWKGGSKGDMRLYGEFYAKLGYVAASISYRLTNEATHPAQVTDAKAAVRWMRANAEKYSIDPTKIAASGNSAGGHLSMMLGYVHDMPELEGDYGNVGVDSRVQAVINFYGPVDLTLDDAHDVGVVVDLMGGKKFSEDQRPYMLESPMFHLTKDDPPTITFHGSIDSIVAIKQAELLDAKLAELGIAHEAHRLEGWPHTMDLAQPVFDYCSWHIKAFLEKQLPLPK